MEHLLRADGVSETTFSRGGGGVGGAPSQGELLFI